MIKLEKKYLDFDFEKIKHKYTKQYNNVFNEVIDFSLEDNIYLSGWLNWPNQNFYTSDYKEIQKIYKLFNNQKIERYLVIGIGGSYIGIKAGIDMLANKSIRDKFIFLSNCNESRINEIINELKDKKWAMIVISKSGSTLESAINFRIFRNLLYKKYKKDYSKYVVAITDDHEGKLTKIATNSDFFKLTIPSNIGGRYSTLTSVGLLVFKLANLDINKILDGYNKVINDFKLKKSLDPLDYALIRYYLLKNTKKQLEVFVTYDNRLRFISEHYKQIFAETEGKKRECLIPTIANFSDDLHSIGQLYQEGNNCFFETILYINNNDLNDVLIPKSLFKNDDQLDYLTDLSINKFEKMLIDSATDAHFIKAKINCLKIKINDCDEQHFGELMAFLNLSACCSACFINVNPFDQPGVEKYKINLKNKLKNWSSKH